MLLKEVFSIQPIPYGIKTVVDILFIKYLTLNLLLVLNMKLLETPQVLHLNINKELMLMMN